MEIDDLNDVKHALWDARAKWKDIGSCIGIDEGTLDTMKGKEPGKSLDYLLSHWLRGAYDPNKKNSKPRTWRTLIIALRDKIINEAAMADELEKEKYPDTNQGSYIIIIIIMVCDRKGPFHNNYEGLRTIILNYPLPPSPQPKSWK